MKNKSEEFIEMVTILGNRTFKELAPAVDLLREVVSDDFQKLIDGIREVDDALAPILPNPMHVAFALGNQIESDDKLGLCIVALCAGRTVRGLSASSKRWSN